MSASVSLYDSIDAILAQAKKAINHRVSEFNINKRPLSKNNKGVIGQIVEEGIFGYPINSNHEADFANLGVELKVTGLKKNKDNHLSMKERLVLNIINYIDEAKVDFQHSSFWKKNELILLLFYLYDYALDNNDFLFLESFLHQFNEKDLLIVKRDWEIIHNKILNGEAHNISEADTMYLAACTKGAGGEANLREQPYSTIKAKQRAYCLKTSYMNSVIDSIFTKDKTEAIFKYKQLLNYSFEDSMNKALAPYIGKSEGDLFAQFNVDQKSKAKFNILVGAMLGLKGAINKSDEFKKGNIELKTIRVEEDGHIEQHMSFPYFKYTEIVKQTWEDADINEKFSTTKFMFVVFKKKAGKYYFDKIKFWNMPYLDIEKYVKPVFELTADCIKNGNIVKSITPNKYLTNFPGSTFNGVCHVRPHDQKSVKNMTKGLALPVQDKVSGLLEYTKYCFWLDKDYIRGIIE